MIQEVTMIQEATMPLAIFVMALSWFLNAMMDAIDHGKGAERLGALWHILKWFSYAIPFGYIMWLIHMPILIIPIFVLCLWGVWEFTYRYLRSIDFHTWDK